MKVYLILIAVVLVLVAHAHASSDVRVACVGCGAPGAPSDYLAALDAELFQASAPAPRVTTAEEKVAPAPPTLDALDLARLETVYALQVRATEACAQLQQAKDYDTKRMSTVQTIEARYPGFTLSLAGNALVPKAVK